MLCIKILLAYTILLEKSYDAFLYPPSLNMFFFPERFNHYIVGFDFPHSRRVLQLQIVAPSLGSRAGFWMKLQANQAG